MLAQGRLVTKVETIIWAVPRPGLNLETLILKLNSQGFSVLEIDRINNRVKVLSIVDSTEDS
jgi:hypothetical protein